MDIEELAERLISAVDELSIPERTYLRYITDLAPGEVPVITIAVASKPVPLPDVALKLIGSWDHMRESERVASLLVFRELLTSTSPQASGHAGPPQNVGSQP